MKPFLAIFFALQMLINSSLAFAHMAVDANEPHAAVHVHMGGAHTGDATDIGPDHEDDAHFHLCAAILDTTLATVPPALDSTITPFTGLVAGISTSPPVPPPNA